MISCASHGHIGRLTLIKASFDVFKKAALLSKKGPRRQQRLVKPSGSSHTSVLRQWQRKEEEPQTFAVLPTSTVHGELQQKIGDNSITCLAMKSAHFSLSSVVATQNLRSGA